MTGAVREAVQAEGRSGEEAAGSEDAGDAEGDEAAARTAEEEVTTDRFEFDEERRLWRPGRRAFLFLGVAAAVGAMLPASGVDPLYGRTPQLPPGWLRLRRIDHAGLGTLFVLDDGHGMGPYAKYKATDAFELRVRVACMKDGYAENLADIRDERWLYGKDEKLRGVRERQGRQE